MRTIYVKEQSDIEDDCDHFSACAYDVVDKAEDVIYSMEDYDIYADSSNGNYEDNECFIKEKAKEVSDKLDETINSLYDLKKRIDKRIEATKQDRWN